MKTVSVRIAEGQAKILDEFADIRGSSRDKMVQRAVKLLIDIEGPVYESEGRALQAALKRALKERQAV